MGPGRNYRPPLLLSGLQPLGHQSLFKARKRGWSPAPGSEGTTYNSGSSPGSLLNTSTLGAMTEAPARRGPWASNLALTGLISPLSVGPRGHLGAEEAEGADPTPPHPTPHAGLQLRFSESSRPSPKRQAVPSCAGLWAQSPWRQDLRKLAHPSLSVMFDSCPLPSHTGREAYPPFLNLDSYAQ